jgi:APA family basic amino acid/polyamine antiporter
MFPAWFAKENRHGTPQRAHIFSSALASTVVLANYTRGLADLFEFMVLVTTSVSIIFYLAGTLASFRLVRMGRIGASPGFEVIAAIGLLYSAWTFYGAGVEASTWSLAMTAAGLPIYLVMTRSRSQSTRTGTAEPGFQPEG